MIVIRILKIKSSQLDTFKKISALFNVYNTVIRSICLSINNDNYLNNNNNNEQYSISSEKMLSSLISINYSDIILNSKLQDITIYLNDSDIEKIIESMCRLINCLINLFDKKSNYNELLFVPGN